VDCYGQYQAPIDRLRTRPDPRPSVKKPDLTAFGARNVGTRVPACILCRQTVPGDPSPLL